MFKSLFRKSNIKILKGLLAVLLYAVCFPLGILAQETDSPVSDNLRHIVTSRFLNPRLYPDDARRFVKPPTWDLFGNKTHFTVLRGFKAKDGQMFDIAKDLDKNVKEAKLGDVIWPNARFLNTSNIPELVKELKERNLYLYQVWGYVPGSGPGNWTQFKLKKEVSDLFKAELGEKWLGMDMGEQDGRYLLGYAQEMHPVSASRQSQYINFLNHMGRISDEMDNKMATLTAVNYAHYLLKEGTYTLVGSEAAQMHPNNQVFYSFNRGAGKQYGVPWFGNASVYNRWGWKSYSGTGRNSGPAKGTSLALMKRLLYIHILYNSMVVGYESGWFNKEQKLSPIGRLQAEGLKWVEKYGTPGVMQTTTGVMLDFYSGWIFPAYNNIIYRVWGNLPYEAGDYLTNNVFGLIYPEYQESSYFHDEKGFYTATPYGDATDALLTDAPQWLLNRYPLLIVAGNLSGGMEIKDKLENYVQQGGKLLITAGSLKNLPGGLAGIKTAGEAITLPAMSAVQSAGSTITESLPFDIYPLSLPSGAAITARSGKHPLTVSAGSGKGSVTVYASAFGVPAVSSVNGFLKREDDKLLANPYPLLKHIEQSIHNALEKTRLFDAGEDLGLIVCRIKKGVYTLGITNNTLTQLPFKITSNIGKITSIRELQTDQGEKGKEGYLPEGYENSNVGKNTANTIAGGDIRIFRVNIEETGVEEIEDDHIPAAPKEKALSMFNIKSIREEIIRRPTFFEHFDGVNIDWKYINNYTEEAIRKDSAYIAIQGLKVSVDLSSGINLFPDLRLVNNIPEDYNYSMATIKDVINKMRILKSERLVMTLHTNVENNITLEKQWEELKASLQKICRDAAERNITVYLRLAKKKLPHDLETAVSVLNELNEPNLKLALNTALLLTTDKSPSELAPLIKQHVGMWLLNTPDQDVTGLVWQTHGRLDNKKYEPAIKELLSINPDLPCVQDAFYENTDEEYIDSKILDGILKSIR
ncbi:MAG: hypothetical protein KIT80_15195 [Chitinophagaceae bacterium]|nr:hypothetical protein [Chitinophagaceae bacterium]MCW5928260.1 hypothetical protein [Chitinophagaceae bacterium]